MRNRIAAAAIKDFTKHFREYTGKELEAVEASDTISTVRSILGKQKLATLSAQKDLLIASLVPLKQLIL